MRLLSTILFSGLVAFGAVDAAAAQAGPRAPPATGGAAGKVDSVSASGFTLSTSAGAKVIVVTGASTTYRKATSELSATAVAEGERVVALGLVDFGMGGKGTTITASEVIVQAGRPGSPTSSAVPFRRGASAERKSVGQVPANYTEGSGTIVGGTEATKATLAALAQNTGGVVNRVVKLSDGEYEVHNVGVGWPHHIFVDQDFSYVGAN